MRDTAMADNLLHELALRPESKFVCWLANGHAQRNMDLVGEHDARFTDLVTMGSVVCAALGPAAYVLITTSHGGTMNAGRDRPYPELPTAAPASLEAVLHDLAAPAAFLDARALPADSPWRRPRLWRSWGAEQNPAPLPEVTDGVLFLDRQRPWHPPADRHTG